MDDELEFEHRTLILRSREVEFSGTDPVKEPEELSVIRKRSRHAFDIPCQQHIKSTVSPSDCADCIHVTLLEQLPNGRLPNDCRVLGYILYC